VREVTNDEGLDLSALVEVAKTERKKKISKEHGSYWKGHLDLQ